MLGVNATWVQNRRLRLSRIQSLDFRAMEILEMLNGMETFDGFDMLSSFFLEDKIIIIM